MALIPSEIPDFFPDFVSGEWCVGPADQMSAPGLTTFYFARFFDNLQPGGYEMRFVANLAATVWVGTDRMSTRMVGAKGINDQTVTFEFTLYEGERRFDIYLQNMMSMPGHSGFSFGLYRDGVLVYVSRAEHWMYDTNTTLLDEELLGGLDTRRLLPVFTVLPNWKDGVLERIEYLTDILSGERATEQRRALRAVPRRSIEVGFARSRAVQDRLHNFFTGVGLQQFLVPLWFEQYRLGAEIGPADTTISFPSDDLDMREFRVGDVALIIDKNPDVFDVVTIDAVDAEAGTITIGAGVTLTWHASARIVPLRSARLMERPSMGNRTDETGTTNVRFELLDGDIGDSSWGYCTPLLRLEPNWAQPPVHGYDRVTYTLDNQIAQPHVTDPSDQTLITQRANYTLRKREQVRYFRDFINQAHGRLMRFYVPSYTDDVQPLDPLTIPGGAPYFDIQPSGLWEMTRTRQFSRRVLGFFFNDGSAPFYRNVESIEPVGLSGPPYRMAAERLYVDQDMPPVDMRLVKRISWMQAVRFDQDGFELKHEVDDSAVVTASLVFRGVDPEGMPPIDCGWITSWLYPVDAVEMLASSAVLTGGRIYEPNMVMEPEHMTSEHVLTGGTLRDILRSYEIAEALDITAGLSEGTIRSILIDYVMEPEAIDVTASLSEGELKQILITYDRWAPEAMDITATLSEGTLT